MVRTKPRVLVVHKKSAYQQYIQEERDSRLRELLRKKDADVLDMRRAHLSHQETLKRVVETLRELGVYFKLAYRTNLKVTDRYDLVVSVGGDGTFLHAARSVRQTPILGVNSDPARSEAVFCAARSASFSRLIRCALSGNLNRLSLSRLKLTLNGAGLADRALNDVLVVHDDPATMSRYRLRIGSREELQKSSGLWVATAAGSSSAVEAAGGIKLSWVARKFQYRPRELYRGRLSRYRLQGGVLTSKTSVSIVWLMRRGAAYLDGSHVRIPLRFGDKLEIRLSLRNPLRVLGLRAAS